MAILSLKTEMDYNKERFHEGPFEVIITKVWDDVEIERWGKNKGQALQVVRVEFMATEDPYKGQKISAFTSPFLTPGSKLTKIMKAVMGRRITVEEMVSLKTVEDIQPYLMHFPLIIFCKERNYGSKSYYSVFEFMRSKYFDLTKHRENALVGAEVLPLDLREPEARAQGEREALELIESMASKQAGKKVDHE